jgi:hypothetical protein
LGGLKAQKGGEKTHGSEEEGGEEKEEVTLLEVV